MLIIHIIGKTPCLFKRITKSHMAILRATACKPDHFVHFKHGRILSAGYKAPGWLCFSIMFTVTVLSQYYSTVSFAITTLFVCRKHSIFSPRM